MTRKALLIFISVLGLCPKPAPAQTRIMPLGDSITWGFNIPGGYRDPLRAALAGDGFTFTFVGSQQANATAALTSAAQAAHEGHNGYRIADITANLSANDGKPDSNGGGWLTGSMPPAAILLHIGTNDALQQHETATMGGRLTTLLDTIFAIRPDARVLVATIIPILDPTKNAAVLAYNDAIENEIVPAQRALGRQVVLVDQYANFVDAGGAVIAARLPGGSHPDQAGYNAMAATWAAALEVVLPLTFAQWRTRRFTPTHLADEAVSGFAADWDGDGVPTLLEWFHGLDPLVSDAPAVASPTLESDGSLAFIYRHNGRAAGAVLAWERSASLTAGSWDAVDATLEPIAPDTDGTPRVRARIDVTGFDRAFIRLRVTAPQ